MHPLCLVFALVSRNLVQCEDVRVQNLAAVSRIGLPLAYRSLSTRCRQNYSIRSTCPARRVCNGRRQRSNAPDRKDALDLLRDVEV